MFGKTKSPNSVCFRLINQRNYNVAKQQKQQRNREERVDEDEASSSSSSSKGSSSSSSSSMCSNSKVVVVFDEGGGGGEVDDEYPNLFLKIVKVIGIASSGLSLLHEPKPALNLATVADHSPFNLWCERGFGMTRKFGNTMFKLSVGIPLLTSGLFIMSYLIDDVDFDAAALDSEEEEEE